MAATQDKTPLAHDSDSDEAPEVVTKQSAAQQARALQQQEEEAKAQAKAQALAKRKRKSKQEPKKQEEVPELSDDVLSAVAARNDEEEELEQQETKDEIRAKKRKQQKVAELLKKKTHTRQFGSIEVQTLDALEDAQTRGLSDSAKEFLERLNAPGRPRMNVLEGHESLFTKKQKQRSQRS
ncbi:hypothetical protein PF005_g14281 [Phytophthora fragariae]|uniref:Uncharacterized protein n=2 Tax=Phytophthora TaxID=4783 RepID=A0A6A3YW83_9STRA|nr:hypothetical protein PF003_g7722 [Phytophthora fragariae]KAE9015524.1 hypothetical protein PR002_g13905 [Phytophthora rubi]KAE8936577.1 hypothetical protein PF009_g13505 [Phytophthora fragariae]KAE8998337.1 hypothetical protein PF011_g15099 [Phytophthora fragariae]KAE9020616.1 hypothetical protein PR001_g13559 [Phytophthora rubi]